MADFKYEIVEKLGVLSESPTGWIKEFNKIPIVPIRAPLTFHI